MNTTNEAIAQNNRLIAEFMGYENINPSKAHPIYKIPKFAYEINDYGSITKVDTFSPYFDDMEFYSNWNWLMEVVEKIESINGFSVIISCGNCEIYNCSTQETLLHKEGEKIQCVYNACIDFIKWYNENAVKEN